MIMDHPNIPDSICRIQNYQLQIPISNETNETLKVSSTGIRAKVIGIQPEPEEKIQYITTKELRKRLQLLQENTRLSHIVANDREGISKIVQSYHNIFTLEGDFLPCTDLARPQIIVKDERPINNPFYPPPEFDLSSGFHQIPMDPESKKYTAISTQDGHFEFERMPFGLKNSPAMFQRMMDTALRGLICKTCFVYLYDVVVFGSSLQEHNENLVIFFQRLRQTGLKLQPDKCEYLLPELKYLGHVIKEEGVKPNPNKIQAVRDLKRPSNPTDVKSFLGLAGYYQKFVKTFSIRAKPIIEVTKETHPFQWTSECEKAFQDLKDCLCSSPVLRYPDYTKEFVLTTDASNVGLGAILSQNDHPCYYISRTLNKPEFNYSTTEKELLAIVWAVKRLR